MTKRINVPESLQERLKQAALRDRDLDLEIANDWFAVDQEQRQLLEERPRASSGIHRVRGLSPRKL
jgi:hypothetical protein